MAYDEALAARVREVMSAREGVVERKMFGGIGWMLGGNMACAVMTAGLVVRLEPGEAEEVRRTMPQVSPFGREGAKPMKGFVLITEDGVAEDADLARWVESGADYASTLPPK
jgi:TfoX/Sxy family transcriptional regulator of competence genes